MILCLGGGLINSRHFIYPSLTAYFLYTAAAAVLIAIAGGKLIIKKQKAELNLPVLLFGAWAAYVLISAVASGQALNTWQTYLIISCLLFIAAMLSFRLYTGVMTSWAMR